MAVPAPVFTVGSSCVQHPDICFRRKTGIFFTPIRRDRTIYLVDRSWSAIQGTNTGGQSSAHQAVTVPTITEVKLFRKEFRPLGVFLGAAAGLALAATQANAHTQLVSAEPVADTTVAAPEKITLHFNDTLETRVSSIGLADAEGNTISITPANAPDDKSMAATLEAPLAPGMYTVSWTAVGSDAHPMSGTLSFTVE